MQNVKLEQELNNENQKCNLSCELLTHVPWSQSSVVDCLSEREEKMISKGKLKHVG